MLAAEPLRERPWEQYLLAAGRVGRVQDALAAYRRADRLFRDELGIEPGAELRRLHSRCCCQAKPRRQSDGSRC